MANLNIKAKRKKVLADIISVFSISIALLMLGFTFLLIFNAKKIADSAKKNIGFTLFLDNNAKLNETTELQDILKSAPYTESLMFVGKEKAADEMKEELGDDFVNFLGNNPLPNSFEVKVKSEFSSSDSISEIRSDLSRYPIIKEFFWEQSLVKAINLNIKRFGIVGFALLILLSLISYLSITGTIRLSVIENGVFNDPNPDQKYNITRERKRLTTGSLITGLLSSSVASLILVSLLYYIQPDSEGFLSLEGIWLIVLIIFIFGAGISGISGYSAVKKYLKDPATFE